VVGTIVGTRSRTAYVEKLKGSTPKGLTQNSGGTVGSGRVENLKPWAKGVSGNPGGRPRTAPITELLRELLQKPCPGDTQNRTYAHKIAEAMLKRASQGAMLGQPARLRTGLKGGNAKRHRGRRV